MDDLQKITGEAAQEIREALIVAGRYDLAGLLTGHSEPTDDEILYANLARESSAEYLEFDEQPVVSASEDGAFVSAWVWVPASDGRVDAA